MSMSNKIYKYKSIIFFLNNLKRISQLLILSLFILGILLNFFNPIFLGIISFVLLIAFIILEIIQEKIKIEKLNPIERKILEEIESHNFNGILGNELMGLIHSCVGKITNKEIKKSIKNKKLLKKEKNKYFLTWKAKIQLQ